MHKFRSRLLSSTGASLMALLTGHAFAQSADIVFIVDESGSMAGEQSFLQTFAPDLNTQLGAAGINMVRFGLVGYGNSAVVPRQVDIGGAQFGSAADFATAAGTLATNGGTEDGYAGINYALQNYAFSTDPNATRVVVLVTDEDRDDTDASLSALSIRNDLATRNIFFAGILSQSVEDPNGVSAIGASATQTYLDQNSDGQFETSGPPVLTTASGTTQADYTDVILSLPNGCFADLNALRVGGTNAQAFAGALADCLISIVVAPTTPSINTFVAIAARGAAINAAQTFNTQLAYRLTGRLGGVDRDHNDVTASVVTAYNSTFEDVQVFNRTYGADIVEPVESGTREFTVGLLKGFVSLSGQWATIDYDNFVDYDRRAFNGTLGLDYEVAPNTILGLAIGGDKARADADNGDQADFSAFTLGAYGGIKLGSRGYVDGTVAYSWGSADTIRNAGGGANVGTTDVKVFSATVTPGMVFNMDGFDVNPSVQIGYANIRADGYTETGPAAVTWAEKDYDVFWATPRVDVTMPVVQDWGTIVPTVGIGGRFQGGDSDDSIVATTAGGVATQFALPDVDKAAFVAAAGVAFNNNEGTMSARIDYTGTFSSHTQTHQATLRVRIAF